MFNVTTGLSIWCSEALTLALILFVAWRHNRKSAAYLFWGLGFLFSGVGFALAAARGEIPNLLSIEIGNAVALLGQSAWVAGFLALDRKKMEWWALLPPAIWLAGVFLPWINEVYSNRVILYNLSSATGATALAMAVAAGDIHRERTRIKLMAIFVLQALLCFGVALTMALTLPSDRDAINFGGAAAMATAFLLIIAFALTCRLIMERSERHLRFLTLTDSLTGVLNRRGLLGYFDKIQNKAHEDQHQVGVILFDLDHFKRVNDRFGHQSGDAVLTAFAHLARQYIPNNIFGRMGGEEFAAIVTVRDQTEAEALAESIRAEFCRLPVSTGEALIPATVSVGIALSSAIEANIDRMVSAADRALYSAKAAGRNCTVVFGEEETAAPAPGEPNMHAGELVPTLDDQVEALRRMGVLSRAG
ncbi:diguanylate cyclase (GGDEF)-like protein [Rhizobium sp. BK529]|uniref:diguanylate cyclase n=1 Tax=unclassified Rhizobium TaxID=2613769 RepID=UPI00104EBA22|nr:MULTISPECIES: diguanylate cyclase [unclassified Rhizobium]MBB3591645.1 diguanylate cyclase (GGDEF)-like protein [Rhizobium sp. BK529]TCS08409.1 diguanylate cyclase (GGDEF)-like protein [Rhizobium sp. BK418]